MGPALAFLPAGVVGHTEVRMNGLAYSANRWRRPYGRLGRTTGVAAHRRSRLTARRPSAPCCTVAGAAFGPGSQDGSDPKT